MSVQVYDVLVIGGGNAGLCAALTARERGASVVVVESAPRHYRGGNSRHTRNLRCMHVEPDALLTGEYSEDEFFADVLRVTGNNTDERLARLVIRQSSGCPAWMRRYGVRFQASLRGTLHLSRTNAFFLGGGKALLNSYYAAAERLGVEIRYGAEVVDIQVADATFRSATVRQDGRESRIDARAVVLASGGFEANLEWLEEAWGDAARNFLVRGTPYNQGTVLKAMLNLGAGRVADARECHAVAIDARAPRYDGGIVTRLDCISLGVVVNRDAQRFYDEGEDFWPKRYAIWGSLVANQPDQIAYCIVDRKVVDLFMPSVFPPIVAQTIPELAAKLSLDADRLAGTIGRFNTAVEPGTFNHAVLDDCRTRGLSPDKTHWAQRIESPPYWAYPLRPGITFTYLGLKVDDHANVLMENGLTSPNIYAAGEIMAGNVLRRGYVAGVGMTIGTVFGRIAGGEAARHAG